MKKLHVTHIALLSIAICTMDLHARTLQQSTNKLLNDLNPFQIQTSKMPDKQKNKSQRDLLNSTMQDIIISLQADHMTPIQSGDMQSIDMSTATHEMQALKDEIVVLKNEIELLKQKTK